MYDNLARVAKMNMIIHDDGHTNIVRHDALDYFQNIEDKKENLSQEKFDLILTNRHSGQPLSALKRATAILNNLSYTLF